MDSIVPLDADRISRCCGEGQIGSKIMVCPSAPSTNDLAWEYAGRSGYDGLCVFAEEQTCGRGRRGNVWHSAKGQSLLYSILLQNHDLQSETLTLAAAVSVAQALSEYTPYVRIKWPNDILVNERKICGILVESRRQGKAKTSVIGIGINIYQTKEFFDILLPGIRATSLAIESALPADRNSLAGRLLEALNSWIRICRTEPALAAAAWKGYNRQVGSQIKIREGRKEYSGTCLGIDPAEGLIVQLNDGPIRFFRAANCSIFY